MNVAITNLRVVPVFLQYYKLFRHNRIGFSS